MKSKVLDRPMFKQGAEVDPDNVGILQGFKDMLGDEWEDEEDYEEMDTDEVSERRPDSPEILMNNLRGDMRSVDARVDELADLVGYGAASETPESVLALLQPVLGAQEAMAAMPPVMPGMPPMPPGAPAVAPQPPMPPGGIAALGGAMPAEMPMPAEAAMAAPPMEAPIAMRDGGLVQRFKDGSDEEGVTAQNISYPPELVDRAREEIANFLAQKPVQAPDLQTAVDLRVPMYQKLLGTGDRSGTQAQILFDIAQAGLNLAAGTTAGGQPLRGRQSAASRLASAFQALPGQIGARVGEMEKEQRQVRLAALQGAEKDIANIREQNAKLVETQRKLFADVMKASGSSLFGKGDWEWSVVNQPGLLANWAAGKTNDQQNNLIQSAITVLTTDRTETRTDPVTQQPYTVNIPAKVPKFVTDAIAARNLVMGTEGQVTTAPAAIPPAGAKEAAAAGTRTTGQVPTQAAPRGGPAAPTTPEAPPPVTYSASEPTLFNMAGKGTGIINVPAAFLTRIPLVGEFVDANAQVQATTFLKNAVNQINRSVATSPRFAEGERTQIQAELNLFPSIIDREEAYINRLIGLDTLLDELRGKAYKQGYLNKDLKPADIAAGREKVQEIDSIRQILGVPPRVNSKADFDALPAGSPYILNGTLRVKR